MKQPCSVLAGCLVVAGGLAVLAGCESDLEPVQLPSEITLENAYVGPQACRDCHQSEYDLFLTSGHGYKLNRVIDGHAPVYPYSLVPNPPAGYTWDDILYVIGGFGWKALFIDQQGYIITGADVQYNLATGGWVAYEPTVVDKPYDCGARHTTGYQPTGNQHGLPGLIGTWAQDGVQCEACHGPGGKHALTRLAADIVVDRRAEMCGQCHSRDSQRRIQAGGDGAYIEHYEQYDEMLARDDGDYPGAGHRSLTCVSCHAPHASTKYNPQEGVVLDCATCHGDVEIYIEGGGAHTCVNCHMPHAVRSAVAQEPFAGDVRSHIFKINPSADALQTYEADGMTFFYGYLTPDHACLPCHSGRDRAWAASHAASIHGTSKVNLAAVGR